MNGTLSSDWLPQQAIWAHSARSRFPAKVAQEKVAILTSRGVASFSVLLKQLFLSPSWPLSQ